MIGEIIIMVVLAGCLVALGFVGYKICKLGKNIDSNLDKLESELGLDKLTDDQKAAGYQRLLFSDDV